jgi:hypothetical protein
MKRALAAALLAALGCMPWLAGAQTSLVINSPTGTNVSRWGAAFPLQVLVTDCPPGAPGPYPGVLFVDDLTTSRSVGGAQFTPPAGCTPTAAAVNYGWDYIAPGWQTLQVGSYANPVKSAPTPFRFDHEFDFAFRGDRLKATLSTDPRYVSCTSRQVKILDRESLGLAMPPPNLRTPYEMIVVAGGNCAPGAPARPQLLALELPETVGEIWRYEAGHWARMEEDCGFGLCPPVARANHLGKSAVLELGLSGNAVFAVVAIAYPQFDARATDLQGLWWAGPSESGWGLTIAKNGERMFVAGYVYDQFGKPTWVVMPNGQWDPNTLVFYGDLYIPSSNPYYSYAGVGLDMRAPVGKGSLSFLSGDEGHFDYTLGDYAGGKTIGRFNFAPRGTDKPPYSGIWWGGPQQDGWGLAVEQQGEAVFAAWYTYGADFQPVWFYMPAGQKTASGKYAGTLYRTTGGPWPGEHYNGAGTRAISVGTMELQFAADGKSGTMTSVVDGRTVVNPIQRFDF